MKKATLTQTEAQMDKDSLKHTTTATHAVPKNFRQQADVEAFYRFVYENDLRLEALDIIKLVRAEKNVAKTVKTRAKH